MNLDRYILDMNAWVCGQWFPYNSSRFKDTEGLLGNAGRWALEEGVSEKHLKTVLKTVLDRYEKEHQMKFSAVPIGNREDLYRSQTLRIFLMREARAVASKHLLLGFKAMTIWIDQGQEPHPVFREGRAICESMDQWFSSHRLRRKPMSDLLETMFISEGLDHNYPFNNGSSSEFFDEEEDLRFYQNPKRLAWLRSHT